MNTWFECKVKYQKTDETGKDKMASELYLIDAISFTEAESRINKELEPYITGEFFVSTIKIANFSELIPDESGDRWFKCKVTFISIDEEKGVERRSNTYMLVQANNVKEAYETLNKSLDDTMSDYEIPSVQETMIMDVFKYFEDEELNPEIPDNLKPLSEVENNNKAEQEEDTSSEVEAYNADEDEEDE